MMTNKKNQQGVTIYLAMLIMSSALATALFVSSVSLREFRIVREVADSARAVYVADSAMEYTLYKKRVEKDLSSFTVITASDFSLSTAACASTIVPTIGNAVCSIAVSTAVSLGTIPGCPTIPSCDAADCTHMTTKGAYGTTNRAFEIVFPNC